VAGHSFRFAFGAATIIGARDLAHCFLRLANLDNGVFDRLASILASSFANSISAKISESAVKAVFAFFESEKFGTATQVPWSPRSSIATARLRVCQQPSSSLIP
jgi:hypothetical protein